MSQSQKPARMNPWKARFWLERLWLFVIIVCYRALDLLLVAARPRLLWAYLRISWADFWATPYRSRGSFSATLAARRAGQNVAELVYGETPLVTGVWLFRRAGVRRGATLLDVGAGRGRALLAARWLGAEARGVELLAAHVRPVQRTLARVGVRLASGEATSVALAGITHVYLTWTGYSATTRARLEAFLLDLAPGARVLALDQPLRGAGFRLLWRTRAFYPWGLEPVWVYERIPSQADLPQ